MNVGSVCSHRIISVPSSASLSEVVALMYGERVGCVIVTRMSAGQPVVIGLVTDRDIVRTQLGRVADFSQLAIADAMTHDPLTVHAEDDTSDVLQALRSRSVRRAPVVDAAGAPIGLISVDDLLQHTARQIGDLAAVGARRAGPIP